MILNLIFTLFLVLLNGFFVAAEFAIVKVRMSQIEMLAKEGNTTASMARLIVAHLDEYLSATQLGITLASLALGWVGESVVSQIILNLFELVGLHLEATLAHSIAIPISFAFITVLHIVFGELAPKSLAIQKPESVTLMVAYPLRGFYLLFKPFIWVLNKFSTWTLNLFGMQSVHEEAVHSPEELKYLVEQSKHGGSIESGNYDLIKNAFDFPHITANLVMIPKSRVQALPADLSGDEMIEKVIKAGYSRIPVYEGSLDNVIGMVYAKDILLLIHRKQQVHIKDILRPVVFISYYQSIAPLLRKFQQNHVQMGIVLNEYGETEGIITLEDVLEEIVGEIQDEDDTEKPVVEKLNENHFRVMATASIADINKFLPRPLPLSKQYDTLAGLLIESFHRIPEKGEKVNIDDYELLVLKNANKTVASVQIRDMAKVK